MHHTKHQRLASILSLLKAAEMKRPKCSGEPCACTGRCMKTLPVAISQLEELMKDDLFTQVADSRVKNPIAT